MYHVPKQLLGLLIIVLTIQGAQAATVSDLLNAMKQRQLSIQDYDFLVARSFYFKAFEEDQVEEITKKKYENLLTDPPASAERMDKMALLIEFTRESLKKNLFTGAIFHSKGIGSTVKSYAIAASSDPQSKQMIKYFYATTEEAENLDLFDIQEIKMEFGQHRLDLSNVIIDGHPPSEGFAAGKIRLPGDPIVEANVRLDSDDLFVLPSQSTVGIKDGGSQPNDRSSNFPFWHEEALKYATKDNTTIVNENEDEVELLITASDTLSFTLYCTPEGRVNRFIKN